MFAETPSERIEKFMVKLSQMSIDPSEDFDIRTSNAAGSDNLTIRNGEVHCPCCAAASSSRQVPSDQPPSITPLDKMPSQGLEAKDKKEPNAAGGSAEMEALVRDYEEYNEVLHQMFLEFATFVQKSFSSVDRSGTSGTGDEAQHTACRKCKFLSKKLDMAHKKIEQLEARLKEKTFEEKHE